MSHFTVLVIGDDVEAQLEPYAEQEVEPQYLVFEDKEDEYSTEYKEKDLDVVVLPDGRIVTKYAEEFRDRNSMALGSQYKFPEGSIHRQGKFTEVYPTFEDYMAGWHGQEERDDTKNRYGYWHNPNAKWDWWVPGGRWSGFFKLKEGAEGEVGESGAFGNRAKEGWVDIARFCDIDFDAMRAHAAKEANETYDKLEAVLKGRPLPSWNAIREKHGDNIDAARTEYHNLQVVQDLNAAQFFIMGDFVETFGNSREEYVESCKNYVGVTRAVVKDGKWYQRGEMGWFGMSHGDMSEDDWTKQFWKILDGVAPETMITMVDCHI